jgi:hypothetical protein
MRVRLVPAQRLDNVEQGLLTLSMPATLRAADPEVSRPGAKAHGFVTKN